MKEILGKGIEKALSRFMIEAVRTYCDDKEVLDDGYYNVYELSDDEFKRLCNIPDSEWQDDFGWWRSAKGSILRLDTDKFIVNGKEMVGYMSDKYEDMLKEHQEDEPEVGYTMDDIRHTNYSNLTEYICEELGASTIKNVTAVAMDLAKMNDMTLSELFEKYQ